MRSCGQYRYVRVLSLVPEQFGSRRTDGGLRWGNGDGHTHVSRGSSGHLADCRRAGRCVTRSHVRRPHGRARMDSRRPGELLRNRALDRLGTRGPSHRTRACFRHPAGPASIRVCSRKSAVWCAPLIAGECSRTMYAPLGCFRCGPLAIRGRY